MNQQFNDNGLFLLYNQDKAYIKEEMSMNLKEAFRYQNHLQVLMMEAENILSREKNVTKVENTVLLHKVNPEAQDETTVELPSTEYADHITEVAILLMFLLEQRQLLSRAIREAKQGMDMDFDGEVSLNTKRQAIARVFQRMSQIQSSEVVLPNAGAGFKFNAEGNQVTYRCDLKKVTTIHFDRNKIRGFASTLHKRSDEVSAALDKCMVNTMVDYAPPFDVNDTFQDVLHWHMGKG